MYNISTDCDVSYRCKEHHLVEKYMPTFGERLIEQRKKHGDITQGQFAKAFGKWFRARKRPEDTRKHNYTQQQVSKWEAGSEPSFDVIVGVAKYFGLSPLYMAGLSDDPNAESENELTQEEWAVVIQMRSNEVFDAAVHKLLDLSRPQSPSTLQEGKHQARIAGSSKTSQS